MSSAGGGRDRDKKRKHVSGAAKRKAKEERAARERNLLSKVPKISTLFSSKGSALTPSGETSDANASSSSISVDVLADVQSQHHADGTRASRQARI